MSDMDNLNEPIELKINTLEKMRTWIERDLTRGGHSTEEIEAFLTDVDYDAAYHALDRSRLLHDHGEIPNARLGMKHSLLSLDFCVLASNEPVKRDPVHRAADMVAAALDVYDEIKDGTFKPDSHRTQMLDMAQFANLFGRTLVPLEEANKLVESPDSTHLAVFVNGYAFRLDIAEDGQRKSVNQFYADLNAINSLAQQAEANGNIGILTCQDRKSAHALRQSFCEDPAKREMVEMIDTALFVVCLNDKGADLPESKEVEYFDRQSSMIFSGNYWNRWYDKSFQLVILEDGSAGGVFNFACYIDGGVGIRMIDDLFQRTSPKPNPYKLPPTLTTEEREAVSDNFIHLVRAHTQSVYTLAYDREYIKQNNLSPDSTLQMAILLGLKMFYSDHPTLELRQFVSVRKYNAGTLDCPYVTSPAVAAFVDQAYENPEAEGMRALLVKAIQEHKDAVLSTVGGRSPKVVMNYLTRLNNDKDKIESLQGTIQKWRDKGFKKYVGDVFGLDRDTSEVISSALNLKSGTELLGRPGVRLPYLTHLGLHYFVRQGHVVFVYMPANDESSDRLPELHESIIKALDVILEMIERERTA